MRRRGHWLNWRVLVLLGRWSRRFTVLAKPSVEGLSGAREIAAFLSFVGYGGAISAGEGRFACADAFLADAAGWAWVQLNISGSYQ